MIYAIAENERRTVVFLLSAGNVEDCTEAVRLLKERSCLKDCNIFADKAYEIKEIPRVETRYDKCDDSFFDFMLITATCIS